MEKINEPNCDYVKCDVCQQLIGPHAPAVEALYGFVSTDGFYIDESIVIHVECSTSDLVERLTSKIEKN